MSPAVLDLAKDVGVTRALDALGVARSTWYRHGSPPRQVPRGTEEDPPLRRRGPRALSAAEEETILGVLHEERFVDRSPAHVVATLLDEGRYYGSVRTMYRILERHGEAQERRAQRRHPPRTVPRLVAKAPNQVWTWDVTRIHGEGRGVWFFLYVLLDLFSRYAVGFTVSRRLSAAVAAALLEETVRRCGPFPGDLTVHNDRGSEFVAHEMGKTIELLDLDQSFSRPRTSNDNAYSESQFKTTKYHPGYPGWFPDLPATWTYFDEFFRWYNTVHRHSGIAYLTPQDVYEGRAEDVLARRHEVLRAAYAAHPERFVNGAPVLWGLPREVWINRPAPTPKEGAERSVNSGKDLSQTP